MRRFIVIALAFVFLAYITGLAAGSTVNGTISVDVWVDPTNSTNTFTLAVDGNVIMSQTTTDVHVTFWPWDTTTVANGSHTLRATVTASGRSGQTTTSVNVSNP
jgi:hypothetical protein